MRLSEIQLISQVMIRDKDRSWTTCVSTRLHHMWGVGMVTAVVKSRLRDTLNTTRGNVHDIDSRPRGCKLQLCCAGREEVDKHRETEFLFCGSNSAVTCCRKDSTGLVESPGRLVL